MSKPKKKSTKTDDKLHKAAQELGKAGGKVGGVKRAASLTAQERSEIARMGGLAHKAKAGVKGSKEAEAMREKKRGTKAKKSKGKGKGK